MRTIEYTIKQLADLAGVTTRTLRYYDKIDLLKPSHLSQANYRLYSQKEIDELQQILFLRELDFNLATIKEIITQAPSDYLTLMEDHRKDLLNKQKKLAAVLSTLDLSISAAKGEIKMNNEEKFAAFKADLVAQQEEKYGDDARKKYGKTAVDHSQQKLLNLSQSDYSEFIALEESILILLKNHPTLELPSPIALKLFNEHRQWLSYTWNRYSAEAHRGLAQMYLVTPEFTEYYDSRAGAGATTRLATVINHYAKE